MKRYITSSSNSVDLFVQYMEGEYTGFPLLRTMTIKRATLRQAVEVMLNKLNLGDNDILDNIDDPDFTKDELIECINICNEDGLDYIFYMENRASGEVFIDNVGPEENY